MQTANHIKPVQVPGWTCIIGFALLITTASSMCRAYESNCGATTGTAQTKTLTPSSAETSDSSAMKFAEIQLVELVRSLFRVAPVGPRTDPKRKDAPVLRAEPSLSHVERAASSIPVFPEVGSAGKILTAGLTSQADLAKINVGTIRVSGMANISAALPNEIGSPSIKNDKLHVGVVTYRFTTTTATGAVRAFASYRFDPSQGKFDQDWVASQIRSMEIGDRLVITKSVCLKVGGNLSIRQKATVGNINTIGSIVEPASARF